MAYLEGDDSFEHRFSGLENSLCIKRKMVINLLLTFSQIFDLEQIIDLDLSSHKLCGEIMICKVVFFLSFLSEFWVSDKSRKTSRRKKYRRDTGALKQKSIGRCFSDYVIPTISTHD